MKYNELFGKIMAALAMLAIFSFIAYAISDEVMIMVGVAEPETYSYTMALSCIQDYYIECSGSNMINQTPIGDPIITEFYEGGFCNDRFG